MTPISIITRFAPSPTGLLHIGGARTALFNYLFAKQHGGKYILRIEDTDRERSKPEFEADILSGLSLLGLAADETYRQSERTAIYRSYLSKLIEAGHAYISQEKPKKEGDRAEVIRFKNPNSRIVFNDIIRGEVAVDTADLGDFVIAKDLDTPLYHLAVVVDDHESDVSHVIRGEDHIANTPRQILIQEGLGFARPIYAHLPLILAEDRSKLSKRHGAVAVADYVRDGYLPEALINFLALLGWSPQHAGESNENEVLTLEDLVSRFRLEHVQKSGAVFDKERLDWLNREHIRRLSPEAQREKIREFLPEGITRFPNYSPERLERVAPIVIDRIKRFGEVREMQDELAFFFAPPSYDKTLLRGKKGEFDAAAVAAHLAKVRDTITSLPEASFSAEDVRSALWPYAEEAGRGAVLWPLRVALSGRERSPDPFTIASVIGKAETLERITYALE